MVSFKPITLFTIVELGLFLFVLPLLVAISPIYIPRFPLLMGGACYAIIRLRKKVNWRVLLARPPKGWWTGPCFRAVFVAIFCFIAIKIIAPDDLFIFPRNRPILWLAVMGLYPFLSVLPQEIIYRVFVLDAHAHSKNQWKWLIVSALLFGWVHCVYADIFAIWTSALAGVILGAVYLSAKKHPGALWVVMLEHSLYGQIVFTVGLGKYFFLAAV